MKSVPKDLVYTTSETDLKFPFIVYMIRVHGLEKLSLKLNFVSDITALSIGDISLIDAFLNGWLVQDEHLDIICRFRTRNLAFTAENIKMWCQILLAENQRDSLCILWKCREDEQSKTCKLITIIYGTSNVPYLATNTLTLLTTDKKIIFLKHDEVLHQHVYVDSVLTGLRFNRSLTTAIKINWISQNWLHDIANDSFLNNPNS